MKHCKLSHPHIDHFISVIKCPQCNYLESPGLVVKHAIAHHNQPYKVPQNLKGHCSECVEDFEYADFENHTCHPSEVSEQKCRLGLLRNRALLVALFQLHTGHLKKNRDDIREQGGRIESLETEVRNNRYHIDRVEKRAESFEMRARSYNRRIQEVKERLKYLEMRVNMFTQFAPSTLFTGNQEPSYLAAGSTSVTGYNQGWDGDGLDALVDVGADDGETAGSMDTFGCT